MSRPTLEEEAKRNHEKASVRYQNAMAKGMGKAQDILTWLLNDIHDSVNPANIGKKNRKGEEKYNPTKYKENTQIAVVKEYTTNNKEYLKAQQDLAKAEEALGNVADDEDYSIELSLSSSDDEGSFEEKSKYN